MIAEALVMKIFMLCMFQIDPRFDKKICVEKMIKCSKEKEFDSCSDFWEPSNLIDNDWYYGDPREADLSY